MWLWEQEIMLAITMNKKNISSQLRWYYVTMPNSHMIWQATIAVDWYVCLKLFVKNSVWISNIIFITKIL